MKRLALRWMLGVSLLLPALGAACNPVKAPLARPRLVVVIVVDQFRYDFVERFSGLFGPGGFRRLVDEGAFFTNANYVHTPTYTAPGHAAIFTGSIPAQNGIVGNNWYDRDAGQEKVMVSDDSAKIVTSYGTQSYTHATKPASPRILLGTTIGDQMRLSNGFRSKVIALSFKDRAAVLPGGREANGAYWFDASSGGFVTSDYYLKELPEWVNRFNAEREPDKAFGRVWDRALAPSAYQLTQGVTTEVKGSPLGRHFPYTITAGASSPNEDYYKAFQYTPFASEYLEDFAKAAVEGEALGADEYPDLLAISFSTPDLVGHSYGPDSEEIEDTYVRLDRVIADWLQYLDRKIGLANIVIAVTGDHGVCPVPRLLSLNKLDAEVIDPNRCKNAAEEALKARFGGDKWVLALVNDQLYLDVKLMTQQKADPAEAERVAAQALLGVPGVAACFTRTQILSGQMAPGWITQRVSNGFNAKRSGDVWLITKPFHFVGEGEIATTHGSPYDYDTHVPLILFGAGIHANRYFSECSPSDIAPTLCALLGVEPPSNRSGRVLVEALAGR